MKTILKNMTLGLIILASNTYASDAAALYETKCASCHITTRPSDTSSLVAPPIMGVMRHVKMTYSTKEEAVNFIRDYVLHPQQNKAVCMPQKIKRFGLMPSQKGNVTKEELDMIGSWMYEQFPPVGFQGKAQGKAQGKSCKRK